MEGESGNTVMSERKETGVSLLHPTVGSDCLETNYVSSHYDVHICMSHVITTPHVADVCKNARHLFAVKFELTILREGCCPQHPDEVP